jgi:hypothetical protein
VSIGKNKVPHVAPILPHAAEKPAAVARISDGKASAGSPNVVELGPRFIIRFETLNPTITKGVLE